jgi:pimeloyl-ACP methyl ester carboxylesterase
MNLSIGAIFLIGLSTLGRPLGAIQFEPCTLKAPAPMVQTADAQCGTLRVPENSSNPTGRQIDLAVAWIPAKSMKPAADPVFLLAGGPGQSARATYPLVASALSETLRKRHIILVDQRGTGASHPLTCKQPNALKENSPAEAAAYAQECARTLDADPRFYSTGEALLDLEAVREAVGAAQINLLGVSYGTRVAQQYAKQFQSRVRSMVLDGVVPNTLVLGSEHAQNLERALEQEFALCKADSACAERFSPRDDLNSLMRQLKEKSLSVTYRHSVNGTVVKSLLDLASLALVVRMSAYSPAQASLLPALLHEASQGRPESLVANAEQVKRSLEASLNGLMELSVICTEDAPDLTRLAADLDTLLGQSMVDDLKAQCAVWPHHPPAANFREPLKSDLPTLLLSGALDPVTPARYADEVLKTLPKGRHLILKGQGHNVFPVGCMPKLMAQFFSRADASSLDASCLEVLGTPAPFISLNGTEP